MKNWSAFWRWLLRRPAPAPPPGTGLRYQTAEQAAARARLLAAARVHNAGRWAR